MAAHLGWSLVDTDDLIVEQFGKSIAAVFRDRGEAAFRAAEREAVIRACNGEHRVISLGGGAPVDPDSRARIRNGNWIVRLEASPETILRRLRASPSAEERPMLAGSDPLGRIRSLLAARTDAYAIANVSVNTESGTAEDVAAAVLEKLESVFKR